MLTKDGEAFCSGTMVNNAREDGRQLFLSANHCIDGSDVSLMMAGFHYQMNQCNNATEPRPLVSTVQGMRVVVSNFNSDLALMELTEKIPESYDVYMAGWNAANGTSIAGPFYGLHHPDVDVKKVSIYNGNVQLVSISGYGGYFWRVLQWSKGVTEPGSSGSALFDASNRIVGHLYGGESACYYLTGADYYGAIGRDYNFGLKAAFDPDNQNLITLDGARLNDLRQAAAGNISTTSTVTSELPPATTTTSPTEPLTVYNQVVTEVSNTALTLTSTVTSRTTVLQTSYLTTRTINRMAYVYTTKTVTSTRFTKTTNEIYFQMRATTTILRSL